MLNQVLNNFIYIPPFSFKVSLVIGKSKIEGQFSSQIDLYCKFLSRCLSVPKCA